MNKIELLAPAGNMECLIAAINNGADAVYLGGKKFGARAFSNNFNDEEMVEAIKLAHKNNVKVYVTVNTIIFNEEIEDVINYLKFLYCNHVDAVLMQDIGLINLTRKVLPNLEIHISTQAHNHNEEAIKYFKGEHDFKAFKASGTSSKSSVRTIYKAEIKEMPNNRIYIELTGNGFLYNMVRIIAGTLVDVGIEKIKPEDIPNIIMQGKRDLAGKTLPPNGLYLLNVEYF